MRKIRIHIPDITVEAKFIASILLLVVSNTMAQEIGPTLPPVVVSVRPLVDIVDFLESRHATVITYEEPLWVYRGDLVPIGKDENIRWGLAPKTQAVDVANILASVKTSRVGVNVVAFVDTYNRQNPSHSFRAISSNHGLHIVPAEASDAFGRRLAANSLLDYRITVPVAKRTPFQTVQALCQAVSDASGIRLEASSPLLRGWEEAFMGANEPSINWGVQSTNARSALIDLLGRSATSMSWRLCCQPSAQPRDRFCVLNVSPIQVTIADRGGVPVQKWLLYDRCTNCPKLAPPPWR